MTLIYNQEQPFNYGDCLWGPFHGGDAETELMEIELGANTAFDLYHHDDTVFYDLKEH